MSEFVAFTDLEVRARELLDTVDRSQTGQVAVANVMRAMWSSSMTREHIESIACAMHRFTELNCEFALREMVKAKILRSRKVRGQRLYEVNY